MRVPSQLSGVQTRKYAQAKRVGSSWLSGVDGAKALLRDSPRVSTLIDADRTSEGTSWTLAPVLRYSPS